MGSAVAIHTPIHAFRGKNWERGGRDRNNERNERREFDGSRTSNLHEEVETTKGDDQAGTEMEAERREQRKNKSENELKGVKKENMERQEMNEGKEIKEKRKRKRWNQRTMGKKKTYQMGRQAICLRIQDKGHNE